MDDLGQQLALLKHGDHICAIEHGLAPGTDSVISFIEQGLADGERAIYLGEQPALDAVERAIATAGINEGSEPNGGLQLILPQDSYFRTGSFDPDGMVEFLADAEQAALDEGYSGLRLTGDAGILEGIVTVQQLISYEAMLNSFLEDSKCAVFCRYDSTLGDAGLMHNVLRSHPLALQAELVCSNPYYEPPALLLHPNDKEIEERDQMKLDWRLARLEGDRRAELEQELADSSLKESEANVRLLLDSTAEGLYGTDKDLRCTFANDTCARLLGYESSAELIGQDMHSLIHHHRPDGSPYPREDCPLALALEKGAEIHSDKDVFWRKDGTSFPVEYWSHAVFRDEELIGTVVTFVDIAKRVALEEQLRQAQKMEAIGNLAGGIAHDFNNLLLVIRTTAAMMKKRVDDVELLDEIKQIDDAASRSADLTHQLLVFGRQQLLRPESVEINDAVQETRGLLERLLGDDVDVEYDLAPGLPEIVVDSGQLGQVMMNLAVNARDAMPGGGRINVSTSNAQLDDPSSAENLGVEPGSYVVLEVSDTGTGMDADEQRRVFDPFYTTKAEGTGLGLATVYGIVTQSGGQIVVESAPGVGTTFRMLFPASTESDVAPQSPRMRADAEARRSLEGHSTILLVEDEPAVRPLLAKALRSYGHTVYEAGDSEQALEIAAEHPNAIDLLVTDVVMPGLNGRQLAERLVEQHPALRLLFTSGYPSDTVIRHGIENSQVAFIEKPFLPDELAAKVREVLDGPVF